MKKKILIKVAEKVLLFGHLLTLQKKIIILGKPNGWAFSVKIESVSCYIERLYGLKEGLKLGPSRLRTSPWVKSAKYKIVLVLKNV